MVATWKKKQVDELAGVISKSTVVGVANVTGMPLKQLQQMRKNLRGKAKILVARNNVIKIALEKTKLTGLTEHVKGPTALVFTDMSPFKLAKMLEANKTTAPAKAGSISPRDIVVPKGDTPFAPGPIIGDLQKTGIKAKIEGGKIVVTQDSVVVKEGGVISEQLAGVLARLKIEPFEIRLKINAANEDNTIYTADVLQIDEKQTLAQVQQAYASAFNLAFNAGIYTKPTLELMLQKAHANAKNLALEADIMTKETVDLILAKANTQAKAVSAIVPETPASPAEEKPAA